MTPVILFTSLPAQEPPLIEAIRRRVDDVRILRGSQVHEQALLATVQVGLGWRLPSGLAARLTGLRWVCSMAAGVEKLLVPELPPAVIVSRVVDPEQALGMAQYAALMALRHARSLPRYEAQQVERRWIRQPMAVARQRVLVLGAGEVGREVARHLSALGLATSSWRRDGTSLLQRLADAEIVINALPLTPETSRLLDAAAFAAMPRGAYLINIARGGHVVEADLIDAVESGHLAGAALDVQQTEPLPETDPLWTVPGITITPHIASQPSNETVAEQFVAGLRCWRRGEAPPNLIDRARGY